jgi:glucose-1-phosphate thymidylyltransferase
MWGIIPAAGSGTRLQPLAFSKELLPVGSRVDENNTERPRAVSEYLVERMTRAGANKICFVISPGKSDILEYYSRRNDNVHFTYVVQQKPAGLCDAIFQATHLLEDNEHALIGLPDTIWFPEDGLAKLPNDLLSFLLFPVGQPQYFDAVVTDEQDHVIEIQVKRTDATSKWIWGAFKMPGHTLKELNYLWCCRDKTDEYFGTLVNAWIRNGNFALGVRAGEQYVDVGTLHGYRAAIQMLSNRAQLESSQSV